MGTLLKLVQFCLSRLGPSAARQHGWLRMYVCDSRVHLHPDWVRTVFGSFMKTEQHLFFLFEKARVSTTQTVHYEALKNPPPKKIISASLCFWAPRLLFLKERVCFHVARVAAAQNIWR